MYTSIFLKPHRNKKRFERLRTKNNKNTKFYKVEVIKMYFTNDHLLVVHDSVILKILNSLDECTNKIYNITQSCLSVHILYLQRPSKFKFYNMTSPD